VRRWFTPGKLILIGFVLMIASVVVPFLMAIGKMQSTLFLNAAAVFASLAGMIAGLYGVFEIVQVRKHRDQDNQFGPHS